MKSIEIKASTRTKLGKKDSRALRLNKEVPCVLYGGNENIHFFAHEHIFKDLIYTHNVYLVHLDVDGKTCQAIMKEVQFHPVTNSVQHIDFMEISTDKPAIVNLPVNLTGSSVGIIEGGKLRLRKRYIKVKGFIADIPDALDIDISDVKIGQSILAGDLAYDKIEILEPKRAAVISVISSRAASKGMGEEPVEAAAAAAAAAPAEGAAVPAEGTAAPAAEKSEKTEKQEKPKK
jgi:large subunit ribosomal protein L25